MDFDVEVDRFIISKDGAIGPADTLGKKAIPRDELPALIQCLIQEKGLPIARLAKDLGVSVTTVRHICRTHQFGVYRKRVEGTRLSCSSQTPYGWIVAQGDLVDLPDEQKWLAKMREMRAEGASLHAIARFLNDNDVPTKNGARWHAKTISQILKRRY